MFGAVIPAGFGGLFLYKYEGAFAEHIGLPPSVARAVKWVYSKEDEFRGFPKFAEVSLKGLPACLEARRKWIQNNVKLASEYTIAQTTESPTSTETFADMDEVVFSNGKVLTLVPHEHNGYSIQDLLSTMGINFQEHHFDLECFSMLKFPGGRKYRLDFSDLLGDAKSRRRTLRGWIEKIRDTGCFVYLTDGKPFASLPYNPRKDVKRFLQDVGLSEKLPHKLADLQILHKIHIRFDVLAIPADASQCDKATPEFITPFLVQTRLQNYASD